MGGGALNSPSMMLEQLLIDLGPGSGQIIQRESDSHRVELENVESLGPDRDLGSVHGGGEGSPQEEEGEYIEWGDRSK